MSRNHDLFCADFVKSLARVARTLVRFVSRCDILGIPRTRVLHILVTRILFFRLAGFGSLCGFKS